MSNLKKIYRIRDKKTNTYMSVGYNRKSSWSVFPGAVIKFDSNIKNNPDDYIVDLFEYKLVKVEQLDIKGNKV